MSDVGGGGFASASRLDFTPEPEPALGGANWGATVAAMLQARPGSPLGGAGQAGGQPATQAGPASGGQPAGQTMAGGEAGLPASVQSVPLPPVARGSEIGGPVMLRSGEPGGTGAALQADAAQATRLPASAPLPPVQPGGQVASQAGSQGSGQSGGQTAGLSPAMQAMLANAGYARPAAAPAQAQGQAPVAGPANAAPAAAPGSGHAAAAGLPAPAAPSQPASTPAALGQAALGQAAWGQVAPARAAEVAVMPPAAAVAAQVRLPGQAAPAEQPRPPAASQAHAHAPQGQPAAAPAAQAAGALMPQVTPLSTIAAPLLAAPGLAPLLDNLPPLLRTRPPKGPTLRRSPQRAQPELWMSDTIASLPDRETIVYTDNRPLALDLFPARPRTVCWRLDDTQALVDVESVAAGGDQRRAALRAAGLHAMLVGGAPNLAAFRVGEGFSTWLGSPLWLRLAGVAKPAEMGVLLAESAPGRLEVMRSGAAAWRVVREPGGGAVSLSSLEGASLAAALYGSAPAADDGPLLVLRAAGRLPPPHGVRVQEAWAAVLRAERLASAACVQGSPPAGGLPWRLAPDGNLAAAMAELRPRGEDVLARVLDGAVHDLDRLDGIALAMVLGRLASTLTIGDHA